MRDALINLNIKAFNKQSSALITRCLEIPHFTYSSRVAASFQLLSIKLSPCFSSKMLHFIG